MHLAERLIRDFLISRGVLPFWADSHLNIIRQGLVTNNYFPHAQHAIAQAATVSKEGHVKRYGATIKVRYPDDGRDGTVRLRYTFNPNTRKAHKLWITKE